MSNRFIKIQKRIHLIVGICLMIQSFPCIAEELSVSELGKKIYHTNCVLCHGVDGAGDGPAALAMNPRPRNFHTEKFKWGNKKEDIFKTITQGVPGTGMPPWTTLTEDERHAVVEHILSFIEETKETKP